MPFSSDAGRRYFPASYFISVLWSWGLSCLNTVLLGQQGCSDTISVDLTGAKVYLEQISCKELGQGVFPLVHDLFHISPLPSPYSERTVSKYLQEICRHAFWRSDVRIVPVSLRQMGLLVQGDLLFQQPSNMEQISVHWVGISSHFLKEGLIILIVPKGILQTLSKLLVATTLLPMYSTLLTLKTQVRSFILILWRLELQIMEFSRPNEAIYQN